ncbi:piggyBac transposable element-derived protein 4-like [Cydia splendana]|uniref:piggyBac transposable element-derived protein 4-like n=1 Tax=Cydia splendana TaxID=1100963 RepID=UPI00300D6222
MPDDPIAVLDESLVELVQSKCVGVTISELSIMKRSRKTLFFSEKQENEHETVKKKKEDVTARRIIIGKRNISANNIYTSPSTGQTLQVLQNAAPATASTSNPANRRVQILEDKIIQPSIIITPVNQNHSPISSDDELEIFSTPNRHVRQKQLSVNLAEENKTSNLPDSNILDNHTFATPKSRKKLNSSKSANLSPAITTKQHQKNDDDLLPCQKEEKHMSSALTSRCGSLSDISTSNMVSLNSSFNEEQLFNLLNTPQKEEQIPATKTKIACDDNDNYLSQPSTSGMNLSTKTSQKQNKIPQTLPPDSDSDESSDSSSSDSSDSSSEDTEVNPEMSHPISRPLLATNNEDDEWEDITDSPMSFEEFQGAVKMSIPPNTENPYDYFKLFVTDEIIDKIVHETNNFANKSVGTNLWKPTDKEEMHTFFAILLAMGLVKVPHIGDYWSKNKLYRNEYISSLMSRDRFLALLKYWHFSDDSNSENDKIHKFREVYTMLMTQFKDVLKPGKVLVVDESMVPWRGRLHFRQYIKNKSHRYGVKLYKVCTPEGYTLNVIVYTGKNEGENQREMNHGQNVVMKLLKDYENEGRIVIADNFYSSIGLAEALLDLKTFYCGTLRSNRKGLPKTVISTKLKKGNITGKMNKKGIRVLKWVDKRPVLMMSTCTDHDTTLKSTGKKRRGTDEEVLKPACVLTYNKFKKGIDLSDQMSSYYSTLKRGLKWYRKVVMELLFGTSVINALIVYNMKNENKLTKKEFIEQIMEKLSNTSLKKQRIMPETDQMATPRGNANHSFEMGPKKRNCSGCYDKLRLTLNSKEAGNKVKKVKTMCEACRKTYCRECYNKSHQSKV